MSSPSTDQLLQNLSPRETSDGLNVCFFTILVMFCLEKGDFVKEDELVAEIETDKVIPALFFSK